jgi:hypothetical protein
VNLPHLACLTALVAAPAFAAGPADLFAQMDANQNGRVTVAEHARSARLMFLAMDADGDGRVTAAEMTAAQGKVGNQKADALSSAEKIKAIDGDGDGVLTLAEHVRASKAMFGKMDANRDGVLSKAEHDAGHAVMLSRR